MNENKEYEPAVPKGDAAGFAKYPSLTNAYALNERQLYTDFPVIAMEKIDGSNFSVHITKTEIKYAKRTGFINNDGELFGWREALDEAELEPVFKELQAELKTTETLILYGEYYGDNVRAKYGKTGFVWFDAVRNGKRLNIEELYTLIYDLREDREGDLIIHRTKLETLKYIKYNNLREALQELPTEYTENINLMAHSPETFEGWVIRPYYNETAFWGVKHKTALFSEKSPEKARTRASKPQEGLELIPYLTARRIENVLSHGDLKPSDGRKLIDSVIDDAAEEAGLKLPPENHRGVYYSILFPLLKGIKQ